MLPIRIVKARLEIAMSIPEEDLKILKEATKLVCIKIRIFNNGSKRHLLALKLCFNKGFLVSF